MVYFLFAMKDFLTSTQIDLLKRQHKSERDGRIRDRIKAVLMRNRGYTFEEIARSLLLDTESVRRHVNEYLSSEKLKPENGGSISKLTAEQSNLLRSHLLETTYLQVKEICAYVKKTFGIKYTISGMTKWLKQASFCYKKPQPIPAKVSKEKQEAFLAYYEELKAGLCDGERIYFGDSVHPQHQTRLAYGWIHKSTKKFMPTTARQKRINIIGAITLDNHQVLTMTTDKVHTASMKAFLKKLRAQNPSGKCLHFILDNAAYNKNKELKAFADELNIRLHYLSPYSPNLNPIERLWKIMHEVVTYNRYYATFAEFTEAILHFFRHVGKKKRLLRKRITDNFQLWPEHAFAA